MWIFDRDDRGWWIKSGRTKLGPWPLKETARYHANNTPEPKPEPKPRPAKEPDAE